MNNTRELQQEFESLIEELGRLRSVNEITTENANSAKKTIDEIESFVSAISEFKSAVAQDYQLKSEKLAELTENFENKLGSLESNVNAQTTRFESLATNHTATLSESFDKFKQSIENTFADNRKASDTSFDKMSSSISRIEAFLKSQLNTILEEQNQNQNELENRLDNIGIQLKGVSKKNQILMVIVVLTLIMVGVSIGFQLAG